MAGGERQHGPRSGRPRGGRCEFPSSGRTAASPGDSCAWAGLGPGLVSACWSVTRRRADLKPCHQEWLNSERALCRLWEAQTCLASGGISWESFLLRERAAVGAASPARG